MHLSNSDLLFIKKNLNKVPFVALAKKFNMPIIEFCKMLRITGISKVIKDIELQYMKDCEDLGVPPKRIKENLGLTDTQYTQICSRHGFKQLRGLEDITLEDAIKNTKWLIEEELKIEVDDFLPGYIKVEHFSKAGLSDCVRFANIQKKKDPNFKHFSAVAFLICNTYPEIYRGYQFSHAKQNNYFKGRDGRKTFLSELTWVIENKMELKLKNIDTYVLNNTFLRTKDLSFYGLGQHTYKHLFDSIDDIKNEMVKIYGNKNRKPNEKTVKLREKLIDAGFSNYCSVVNCDYLHPEVHHIIPKREKMQTIKSNIDFDELDNLVFLCPNHHELADETDWKPFLKVPSNKRRAILLESLNEKD